MRCSKDEMLHIHLKKKNTTKQADIHEAEPSVLFLTLEVLDIED